MMRNISIAALILCCSTVQAAVVKMATEAQLLSVSNSVEVARTNAITTANAYTDAAVASAGSLTPEFVTNAAAAVVVRDVPAWALNDSPPEAMSANALVLTNNAVKTKDGRTAVTATMIGGIVTGENYSTSFSLNPSSMALGGSKIVFSNSGVASVSLTGDANANIDPAQWNWLKVNGCGLGGWLEEHYLTELRLNDAALRVASRTWDTGYNVLWEKTAHNGGFYEVCVTNVNLTAGGVQ